MITRALLLLAVLWLSLATSRQDVSSGGNIYVQETAPPAAGLALGYFWLQPSTDTFRVVKALSPLTWVTVGGGGDSVPTGSILLVATGTCPTGYVEETALDGRTPIGTLAAHGDIGTTSGSDTITPAGSVSAPVFTGTSAQVTSAVSAGTPAGTNGTAAFTPAGTNGTVSFTPVGTVSAATFTGTPSTVPAHTISWPAGVPTYTGALGTLAVTAHTVVATKQGAAAGNVVTTATHAFTGVPGGTVAWPAGVPTMGTAAFTPAGTNSVPVFTGTPGTVASQTFTGTPGTVPAQVFTGSALGTHTHTLTPAGTNSAPAFTGTPFDNRSASVKVIFCRKT